LETNRETCDVVRVPSYGQRRMPKKYKEVRAALIDAGWAVERQTGSHEVWAHPNQDARIVVAGKGSDTVPAGTLGSIRRASGLEQLR
jgi:predicted RNA binding protein YcfA (HicA-like mRNA interferase family)